MQAAVDTRKKTGKEKAEKPQWLFRLRICFTRSEPNGDSGPQTRGAFQINHRVVQSGSVLDDAQAQTCAADGAAMAFIHPVKPLKTRL